MADSITTSGKKLRVGQRIRLQVASPVMLGSSVVIPTGCMAEGEITDVRNKGIWGSSGRIEARVLNVRVDDRSVRLPGRSTTRVSRGRLARSQLLHWSRLPDSWSRVPARTSRHGPVSRLSLTRIFASPPVKTRRNFTDVKGGALADDHRPVHCGGTVSNPARSPGRTSYVLCDGSGECY